MIAQIKINNKLYTSPIFAELGASWKLKCVVRTENGEKLRLVDCVKRGKFQIFFIDESVQEGWIEGEALRGFPEIINNKSILTALKKGKEVDAAGLNCVKSYSYPIILPEYFSVNNQKDAETFNTICWGLHDAHIDKIERRGKDLIVDFDTTWEKHIIMTFYDVINEVGLDCCACILGSSFEFMDDGSVKWKVDGGFNLQWDGLDDDQVYITCKKITYKLVISDS